TLVIEVSFYIALPFIAWFLRSIKRADASPRTKLRTQLLGLLALCGTAMIVRVWRLWVLNANPARGGRWFPIAQVGQWLPGYLDWFSLGMLLAGGSARPRRGGESPALSPA